jgi:hypothetical protein
MPGEGDFDPFRQKTLSPPLPTSGQCCPAAFAAHPRTETMLLFTGSL